MTEMPRIQPIPFKNGEAHRRWELTADWHYSKWNNSMIIIPKGFIFNGASIPKMFSSVFASTGILFLASLVHCHLYQYRWIWVIKRDADGEFYPLNKERFYINKSLADDIFKEIALISYPDYSKSIWVAKKALTLGGGSAWNACRKAEGNYKPPIDHSEEYDKKRNPEYYDSP